MQTVFSKKVEFDGYVAIGTIEIIKSQYDSTSNYLLVLLRGNDIISVKQKSLRRGGEESLNYELYNFVEHVFKKKLDKNIVDRQAFA